MYFLGNEDGQAQLPAGDDRTPTEDVDAGTEHSASTTPSKIEWTHNMVLLLLDLYKSHRTQFRSAKHFKSVWEKVAAAMASHGYKLSWQLCEKKFRNLKGTFKNIKDNNRQTGRGRKNWPYYDIFIELMGDDPAISPTVTECGAKDSMDRTASTCSISLTFNDDEPQEPGTSDTHDGLINTNAQENDARGLKSSRKRKRQGVQQIPSWFNEFLNENKKTEEAKLSMLQLIHTEQKQAAAERVAVMRELNCNIRALIEKL